MKRKLVLTLTFCCVMLQAQNIQNTYLDAVKLAKMYAVQNQVEVFNSSEYTTILKKYGIDNSNNNPILLYQNIDAFLKIRPKANISESDKAKISSEITLQNFPVKVKDLKTDALSGLSWQSAVINGTATFMAERFKAEMTNSVLQKMFDKVQDDNNTIVMLFPKTLNEIKRFYPNQQVNSYYSSDLTFLRQVIVTDINNMPSNIIESKELLLKMPPSSRDFLVLGYNVMKFSKEEYPLTDIMEKVSKIDYETPSIQKITSLHYMLSEALRDTNTSSTKWVNALTRLKYNPEESNNVNDLTATFFYALLYEQLREFNLFNGYTDPQEFTYKMQSLLSNFNSFNSVYQMVEQNKLKKGDVADYLNYTNQIITAFSDFARNNIIKEAYGIESKNIELIQISVHIVEPILKQEYKRVIPIVFSELGNYLPGTMNLESFRPINFLAQVGTAETSADMENVLNSFALPIGSASIKRGSRFNISINGYVGLTAGSETAYSDFGNETKSNVGLAAPIGISASMRPFTLFASIIDLGTMVNIRLGGDNNSYSGLKFEHFLSPGLGLYYNIPRAPVSFGLHYSYVPNLRTIKFEENYTTTVDETNANVSRVNFSVLIDIPFLTIYSK